jgi:hypothetical protein
VTGPSCSPRFAGLLKRRSLPIRAWFTFVPFAILQNRLSIQPHNYLIALSEKSCGSVAAMIGICMRRFAS